MTQEIKRELKKEGFTVVQTSYWIIGIIVILIGLGVNFGMTMKRIDSLESRMDKIDKWKEKHIDWGEQTKSTFEKQLYELQINLKVLMEKQGLTYQQITK